MKRSKVRYSILACVLGLAMPIYLHARTSPPVEAAVPASPGRLVELCICLDTSGSMEGLINSAREKLWSIVNDLALARPTPNLRVALLTYGNDGHNPENGWVKVETPFTEDLDKVSEMLFALTTNGGTELVGRVVQTSIHELEWTPSEDALKLIFVAGNESADQDSQAPFREICREAISAGVMVNSIYCVYGSDGPDVQRGWEEVARLADGQFATIDQNNGSIVVATPFDKALVELSSAVNETYIPFGEDGQRGWANQQMQDKNAAGLNHASAAQRAQTKAGALYACSWDLVDACRLKQVELAEVKVEDLPEEMQTMTLAQREQFVQNMLEKRQQIQEEINALTAQRQQYVVVEQNRRAEKGVDGFDLAVRNAVRQQARAKGFEFAVDSGGGAQVLERDAMPYFIRIGDNWVSANYIDTFERHSRGEPAGEETVRISEGDETYAEMIGRLDPAWRDALQAIGGGRVFIRVGTTVYEIRMNDDASSSSSTMQIDQTGRLARLALAPNVNPAPAAGASPSHQVVAQQIEVVQYAEPAPAFIRRGDFHVDATFIDEYDELIGRGSRPAVDEKIENTPQGRADLLRRVSAIQRNELEAIFSDLQNLMKGGLYIRVDGKLLFLEFGC